MHVDKLLIFFVFASAALCYILPILRSFVVDLPPFLNFMVFLFCEGGVCVQCLFAFMFVFVCARVTVFYRVER